MSNTIVLHNLKKTEGYKLDGSFYIPYKLEKIIKFSEPYCVRLSNIYGLSNPLLCFCEFVALGNVNGKLEGYLGCSSEYFSPNYWLPCASDHIPEFGHIRLKPAFVKLGEKKIFDNIEFTIVIDIAPLSWVKNGRT